MPYDDKLVLEHLGATHASPHLTDRDKQLIGLAVTLTRGCVLCTRNRIEKAKQAGFDDDTLNAVIAVAAAVNSGVTAATARQAFGQLEAEAAECGDACSPTPGR